MARLGVVVGIDSINGVKGYRVLIATISPKQEEKQYNWGFQCKMLNEQHVIDLLRKGAKWLNIELDKSGKVKGSSGDLKRFEPLNNKRPYVIISQLVNSDNKIIGYKIANYDGSVKNIPIKEMIAYGKRASKHGCIPVQNAIFVNDTDNSDASKSAHFKSYPNHSFLEERIITNRNVNAERRRINTVKNEKTLSKLEQIYTKEQINQLRLGKEHNIEYRIYANPELTAEKMKVLREGLEKHLNVRPFAFPDYSVDAMKFYIMDLESGLDIRQYTSPKYSIAQIAELSIAADEGLDLSKLADPSLSVEKMSERRIRLENNVFRDEDVDMDGSWI